MSALAACAAEPRPGCDALKYKDPVAGVGQTLAAVSPGVRDTTWSDASTAATVSPWGSLSLMSDMPSSYEEGEAWFPQAPDEASSAKARSDPGRWSEAGETLIIVDWDDALCPTTAVEARAQDPAVLAGHSGIVEQVLRIAAGLGHVEIVTMATKEWVAWTLDNILPSVRGVLLELGIPFNFAAEDLSERTKREACDESRNPSQYLKRRTMRKVIKRFYRSRTSGDGGDVVAQPRERSWKNVISIGDSCAERFALQDLILGRVQHDRHGRWQECYCKVVKLLEEPTVLELAAQLLKVGEALPHFVCHDGDLDIVFDEEDVRQAVEYLQQHG